MHLTSLHLRNFRNYQHLDLELPPGLLLFTGANAQGKSNLLEAGYLLAIGRSARATNEREVVGWSAPGPQGHAQVAATIAACQGTIKLQVDYLHQEQSPGASTPSGDTSTPPNVQKRVRINGIPRRASGLVGMFNAVLFDASDIHLVEGAPSLRRRYLDILLSQVDPAYLRALQRYQRVLTQRNHLLRLIREGRSREQELEFWDEELAQQGAYLLSCRLQAVTALSTLGSPIYTRLTGGQEELALDYLATTGEPQQGEAELRDGLRQALLQGRRREAAMGATQVGPHRDDLRITAGRREIGVYGSRGERRIAALTLRLAEGEFLSQRRGDEPVLLLDDTLSELDATRSQYMLETVASYGQVLLTTTEAARLPSGSFSPVATFQVAQGTVTPLP